MFATAVVENDAPHLAERAVEFENARAESIIAWAVKTFGNQIVLACSFQECAIIDLAVRADPGVEVVFLDTGCHFEETLSFVEEIRTRYDLNLRILRPTGDALRLSPGREHCCELRKVAPLNRALKGRSAWMTGLKRCDSATRAHSPITSWDKARGLVKVNPIANWTDEDLDLYTAEHHLPVHPLVAKGYPSIGCAPCTSPVTTGADRRSGRWAGSERTECGIHLSAEDVIATS
jgi:phosphoadenosine phosphosulfate reductase